MSTSQPGNVYFNTRAACIAYRNPAGRGQVVTSLANDFVGIVVDPAAQPFEITGGATLPASPAAALLDAAAPGTFVGLNGSGVGETLNAAGARARLGLPGLASLTIVEATFNGFLGTNGSGQGVALSPAAALTRLGLPGLPSVSIADVASPLSFVTTDALGAGDTSSPSEARELLELVNVPSLASSAGWTTENGLGAASITGGAARVSLTAGVPTGVVWANFAKVTRPSTQAAFAVALRARIKGWTGGNDAAVSLGIGLRRGVGGIEGLFASIRGNGGLVDLYGESLSGGGALATTAAPARGDIAGGEFWVELLLCPTGVSLAYGVGVAGAEPTVWTYVGSVADTTGWRSDWVSQITLSLGATGGGSPDNCAVDLDNISTRVLGLA